MLAKFSPLRAIVLGLISIAFAAGQLLPASAAVQQPPGSRIKMDVPDTFEVSKLFSGFVVPIAGMSIVIAELPTTRYADIVKGFTDAALANKGITKVKRSKLGRKDEHLYLVGEQTHRGRVFKKFVLLIKDEETVAVITANVEPSTFADGFVNQKQIVDALTSAHFAEKPAPIIKQFELGHLGPFKQAGKLSGSAILYTTDGSLQPPNPGVSRSMLIIAPSVDRVEVRDLKSFSERALRSLGGYAGFKIESNASKSLGGLEGAAISATAKSSDNGEAVHLRQVVLGRKGGGYFRLLAIIRDADKAALLSETEKVIESFSPTE
ncbi:MAG: hypothetical protein ACR2OV_15395 [Hyphomicrobiaceae bacterium]